MPWKPTTQTGRNYPEYTAFYNRLVEEWGNMPAEQQAAMPLSTFIELGMKEVFGGTNPQLNQAAQTLNNPQGGRYHMESSPLELVEGSAGGKIIGPANQTYLGEQMSKEEGGGRRPLYLKGKNAMLGILTKDPIEGTQINFKREVSPYMMYHHPEDPTMWDEMPDPNDPGLFKGRSDWYEASQQVRKEWNKDRQEDWAKQSFRNELRKKDIRRYMEMQQAGTLEQLIDAMMQQSGG